MSQNFTNPTTSELTLGVPLKTIRAIAIGGTLAKPLTILPLH
jgi:hypothetical protein